MRSEEMLVLNYRNFSSRLESLFGSLGKSPAALESFARDPAGVFGKHVFPEHNVSAGELNQANRVLFSLLSNPRFLDWSKKFEQKIRDQLKKVGKKVDSAEAIKQLTATLDRAELYKEIAKATLSFADLELIYSMTVIDPDVIRGVLRDPFPPIGPDPLGCDLASVAVEIETFVYAVAAVAVFVVAVAAVAVIPAASVLENVSREDLRRVSNFMTTQLLAHANEVRLSGSLTSVDAAKRGPVV